MSAAGLLLALLGLGLALLALAARLHSARQRERLGLPKGRIVSADTGGWKACLQPLYSARYRLAGRPDYLVEARRALVPAELKPARRAERPYQSDVLQLGAYLLLVEEETGRRPPYGLLCYAGRSFEIPYTPALRRAVIESLAGYRRRHRSQITVVFDAGPQGAPGRPAEERRAGMRIIYARPGRQADDTICALVRRARDRRGWLVVTSGRALQDEVRRLGASVIPAGEFARRLTSAPQAPVEKERPPTPGEVDAWLQVFSRRRGDRRGA